MTTTCPAPEHVASGRRMVRPGTGLFTFVMAMGMAITALGIDTLLPAFPEIRATLGLASDSNDVAGLVTFFLLGSSVGLLPAGLIADRYGRLSVMYGGLALYVAGAVLAVFAPSLTLMFVGRFIWGLGSAGPRVAVMAMVRDSYAGEAMAKQMSFIFAVFLLVPAFAPTLASGLLAVGPWQTVYWACVVAAIGMSVLSLRLPETLAPSERIQLDRRGISNSCRTVIAMPGTIGYIVSMSALIGALLSYVASSEIIVDEVFGLEDWFPLIFGVVAVVMGVAVFINGRIVVKVGLDRIIGFVFAVSVPAVSLLLVAALVTDGRPPFWLFLIAIAAVLFCVQILLPNLNAAAMRPLAHVAGTGSAILGMIPGVFGSLMGMVVDRQFDGSITPMAISFAIATVAAFVGWRQALAATTRPV